MEMLIRTIRLDKIVAAPWRFSEDLSIGHESQRSYTPIQRNIVESLTADGQTSPIHVRPISQDKYEILDGHIVVDAAGQLHWEAIEAVVHEGLSDEGAKLLYIHFNLNRCGFYGHCHVKMMHAFGQVSSVCLRERAEIVAKHVAFSMDEIMEYVELQDRSNPQSPQYWQKFNYSPGGDTKDVFADEDEDHEDDDYEDDLADWE